nr:hypothetical protein [uncultured Lichenicoccus sp.]
MSTYAQSSLPRNFYVWMAAGSLAVASLGFVPTYFQPIVRGTIAIEPVVHIHALVLFGWMALFFVQSWMVAHGRILAHRSWGMLGIAVVTAMCCLAVAIISLRISQASLPGQRSRLAHAVREFELVPFSMMLFFASVFAVAIVKIRRPETHKRLMLLFTIALLGAPVERLFLVYLAPPRAPGPRLPPGLPIIHAPPVLATIPPALFSDILLVVAILFDYRTRGRLHPVYLVGGVCLVLVQLSPAVFANTPAWQAVATAIGHLAG